MDKKILAFVKKVRGRLKEQTVIDGVTLSVMAGLFLAVIISVISIWIALYYAIPTAAGVVLLSFAAGIIAGIMNAPTPVQAALAADAKGYKEKFVTAYTLVGRDDAFSTLQKKDAVKHMDDFSVKKEFPLKVSWKKFMILLVLSSVFFITAGLDTPARREAVTKHDVKKDSLEEIAKLDKLKKEIAKSDKLNDIEKTEINKQLDQAKQDMRKAQSYEDLKKAEDIITKKMEMNADAIKDASVKEALENAAGQNKADQAKKIEEAMKEAEEAMNNAFSDNEKSRKDAYEKLNKLAEISGNEALKKAAKNYKNSDYSNSDYLAANQALKNAKDSMNNSDLADNSANGQGNNSSGNTANEWDNGNTGNNSNNNSNGSNNSNSDNNGSGSNNENSSNGSGDNNQGQNGNGNGQQGSRGQNGNGQQGSRGQNGNGNSQGNDSSGNGSGSGSGAGWNRGSKNGSERSAKVNEDVTIPDGTVGNDDNLSGKANDNDTSTKQKSSQANTWSGNKVSYGQVSGQYKEKAYKKVNGSSYPTKMKDKIRIYFDGLE